MLYLLTVSIKDTINWTIIITVLNKQNDLYSAGLFEMFLPTPIVKATKTTTEIMLIVDNIKDVTFSLSFLFFINEIIVKTTNKMHIPKMIKRPIIFFSEKISSIPLPKIGCKDLSSKPAPKLSVYITHKYNNKMIEKTKLLIKCAIFINITPYVKCTGRRD